MGKRRRLAGAAASLVLMAGTAHAWIFSDDVDRVKRITPEGAGFASYLAREYRGLSMFESEQMYDWIDADLFAKKAIMANGGTIPAPERVENWNIPDGAHRTDLAAARSRLVAALDRGAAAKMPELAAVAQVKYDCWIEQQEEGWQFDHIAICRSGFHQAMADIDKAMAPPPAPPRAEAPPPPPRLVAVGESQAVYFDFDKAEVTPAAHRRIDGFVSAVEEKSGVQVMVTGHADRSGSDAYNMRLSERRAEAVRTELIRRGLRTGPLDSLRVDAKGERAPAVATPDGAREPANRRVILQALGYEAAGQTGELRE